MITCKCGISLQDYVLKCPICGRTEPSKGLGDTIYKLTTTLRIPHCGGCENRPILSRQGLNKLFPYKKENE